MSQWSKPGRDVPHSVDASASEPRDAALGQGLRHRGPASPGGRSIGQHNGRTLPHSYTPQTRPMPRWLFFVLSILIVMALSLMYALERVRQRRRPESRDQVTRLLDPETFHHVGIATRNLTKSMMFYTEVLGGRLLHWPGMNTAEKESKSSPKNWQLIGCNLSQGAPAPRGRLVSFGPALLLLWELPALQEVQVTVDEPRAQLALRLAPSVTAESFLAVIQERLRNMSSDLSEIACSKSDALQPDWDIIHCKGPDSEQVQFWRPSLAVARALDAARKEWISLASDGRGRDIFE